MSLKGTLVLPEDILLVPAEKLQPRIRRALECQEGDYAITRPRGRARSFVVDADSADVLGYFRQPKSIAAAIAEYSAHTNIDSFELLNKIFPLLLRLYNAKLLVPPDESNAQEINFILEVGDAVNGWEILSGLQALEDTDVYQCGRAGKTAALKLMRHSGDANLRQMFDRERRVLEHLDGNAAPKLMGKGTYRGRLYLALEWLDGIDILTNAQTIRIRNPTGYSQRLIRICLNMLEAYRELHARSVIHSDIHPKNVLVSPDNTVHLIDFGLSRVQGSPAGFVEPSRQGVGYFFEPEYAKAILSGMPPPQATIAGELYGLAALIYLLLTGWHYLDFLFEKTKFLRQIVEERAVAFADRGLEPWPAVEGVLGRALSKAPEARFSSAIEFAEALRAASRQGLPSVSLTRSSTSQRQLGHELISLLPGGDSFDLGIKEPPTSSVHYGAAGVGYALYRVACLEENPAFLAGADIWANRAFNARNTNGAYSNAALGITPSITGPISLHHSATGIHCVELMIAHARWDTAHVNKALQNFIAASSEACDNLDMTLGSSSSLLGCAMIAETIPEDPLLHRGRLLKFGNELASRIWSRTLEFRSISECAEFPVLGLAHGWAGILFAQLRWVQATGGLPPLGIDERLTQLTTCSTIHGLRRQWPSRLGKRETSDAAFIASWCNGSSGYVHLYILAAQILHNQGFLELAEQAAWETWENVEEQASICCGLAGRAYSLLSFYRTTGEKAWLQRARALGARASLVRCYPSHSLYKGDLGIDILNLDLQYPERSALPFFESEGWPRRG